MEEDYYGEEDSVEFRDFRNRAVEEDDNLEAWEAGVLEGVEGDWEITMSVGAKGLEEEDEE